MPARCRHTRSRTQISRWERGQLGVTVEDTAAILAVLGVRGERREEILTLAREAADPNWVAPGVTKHLAMLTAMRRPLYVSLMSSRC